MQTARRITQGLSLVLVCVALTTSSGRAWGDSQTLPKKTIAVEGVTEYELENGGRVVLFPDPLATKVTVNMVVFVGSRHEGYGEAGMAHLLEHLVFKGTPSHQGIYKLLSQHGAVYNAITDYDHTHYYETMPASDENLEFAIKLEADRLVNSFIKREDLLSEMTVVRNEFEIAESQPLTILGQRMRAAAYAWHNYGKNVLGNRSDIERVPIDRLQAFYRKYYQPDNAMLLISGKFDETKALEHAGKYFGALKRPARVLDTTYTEEPPQDGERTVVLRRVGSNAAVGAVYHIPAARHEDSAVIDVLVDVLTSTPGGRLNQALVESKKAIEVAGFARDRFDPSSLCLCAVLDQDKSVDEVRDILLNVVEGLQSAPVTLEEVDRAKRNFAHLFEQSTRRGEQMAITLGNYAAVGDWRLFFWQRDRYTQVTPSDVTRVAGKYLQRNNRTVGLFLPTKEAERVAIPEAPAAAEILRDFQPAAKTPPAGVESPQAAPNAQGEKAPDSNRPAVPSVEDMEKRIQRSQLPGDVKVALLQKQTADDNVRAQLVLRFGNEQSLKSYPFAPAILAELMVLGGTKNRSMQQLQDEMTKLKAGIRVVGDTGALVCSVTSKKENFPQVLGILGEILREPLLGENEFNRIQRQYRHNLEAARTNPALLAQLTLDKKLNPLEKDQVRYRPSLDEALAQVDALTIDRVRELYAEQLGGQVGEFAVVGEFDPQGTLEIVQRTLGDWKASIPYRPIPATIQMDVAGSRQDLLIPDKANAFYVAARLMRISNRHPDYYPLVAANHIFGADQLNSRLGNGVRHKEGLSYSIQSDLSARDLDDYAQFMIVANANPQNIDKLETTIIAELATFLAEGITEAELAETKKALLQQRAQWLLDDDSLLFRIRDDLHLGLTLNDLRERNTQIAGLTVVQVNAAIRKHLSPDHLVIIRAGDLKNASTTSNSAPAKALSVATPESSSK